MQTEKKYRMVMINPAVSSSYNWDMSQIVRVLNKKTVNSPLALPLLAAYMPENWDVEIVDEEIQKIDFNDKPDIVALSLLTIKTVRGYQIASKFRKQGVKVLLGGPHVTLNGNEAGQYADAIVIGEGENVWLQLLRDFEKGELKEKYQSVEYCKFKTSPIPRWDLLDKSRIMTFNVQVSRGCPYSCEFCSVRTLFGRKQRYRDIDDVIKELSTFAPGTVITFADDNLTANRKYIKELLRKMIPLKLMWNCQASIDCAFDPELLQLMKNSGCLSILIGFETLDKESLDKMNKPQNSLDDYEKAISNIHNYGIHIYASFIVGLDNDTIDTFQIIEDFTLKNNLCYVMVNALNAFKGTDFYNRLENEGRILELRYDATGNARSNVRAKKISPLESFNGILALQEKITSPESVYKKSVALLLNGSFTHDNGEDVSFIVKLNSTFFFLFKYILSFNKWNRKLFFTLLKGVKEKRLSFFCFVQHILFMETFRQSFKKMHKVKRPIIKELEYLNED